jgi:hypothetical protein
MDKMNFKEKVDAMMPDLIEGIRKECERLFNSSGIDTTKYEDDYRLPKIILTVALENQIRQYSPLSPSDKKEVKNLQYF